MVSMKSKPSSEQQATVAALLDASKRPSRRVNIRNVFVQGGDQKHPIPGPLAQMVRSLDVGGLDLYLLHRALVSSEPWTSRALQSSVWARALGLHNDSDGGAAVVSKTWKRLATKYQLIERGRSGRIAVFTSLREDGSGQPYTSPNGSSRDERFFTLPFEYWTAEDAWYRSLPLPAKAVLLIGSTLKPDFVLPTVRAKDWYGISTETAQRGLRHLREVGLIHRRTVLRPTPLGPTMTTQEFHYTLRPPFGRQAKKTATRPALTIVEGGVSA
jgi:hypothetical protein